MKYLALFRGVNVGGKNKLSMAELKTCLEGIGFTGVRTYINSGNALFQTSESAAGLADKIEKAITKQFTFDSDSIKVVVVSENELTAIVKDAPQRFGQTPQTYHSDVLFVIGVDAQDVYSACELNPDVDAMWLGKGVVYFQRVSALRTRSKLSKIIAKPIYKNVTIRSWSTTTKLLALFSKD